ncbi:MAG: hypothetical protein LBH01_00005, partial [Verrucomicrobiales bacterium]|nr:hypothetical protein [Verrucomicrobiales bacterium]
MINNKLKIILSVLCASALNIPSSAQAQNKYITSGTVAESGSSYQSISNRAALEVTGSMTSYSGTGITLSATFNSGNGRYGAYVYNQGSLALTSGSIITSGSSSGFGVYLNGTSTARLNDVGITTEGDNAQGIRATGSSTLTGQNISIATTGSASHGVLLQNGSHAEIDGLTVVTGSASGIRLETSSSASLSNVNVAVSADNTDNSFGVYVNGTSRIEIDGLTITATDAYGIYLTNGSSGSFAGVNITTVGGQTGVSAFNASVADLGDGAVIRVSGTYVGPHFIRGIDVSGTGSIIRGSGMDIETNGVYLVTSDTVWQGMAGVKVSNGGFLDLGENTRITALGVTDEGRGSPGIFVQGDTAVGTVTGTGVMVNATGAAVQVVNAGYVELTDGNLSGGQNGISISGTQASEIVITGGTITAQTGDIVHGSSYLGSLTLVESTNSTITISDAVLNASGLVGTDQDGLLVVNFNNVDASNAGGITMDSETSGTTTVNVNGGSGVYGDVTNSGSGELNVNFDHSGLTGDVTNDGDGTLTITLDNGSSGTGGFNGGNLNINDSESSWTFDKDSHVNDALNNGTLNIGDKDVTFDNLTNNGKINLDVNSDSGAGGSVNVTGTAGGNGTVHVDTTGNGSLDPNSVLPGLVSGDGTENWTWDPVDWGLEKVIKDGNHFTRDGISSAGAVLNSSNAV